MGRGKQLNQSEIDCVLQLKEQNFKISQIAKTIDRSRTVIETLLKDPLNYGISKKGKKRLTENGENNVENGVPTMEKEKVIKTVPVDNGKTSPPKKQKKTVTIQKATNNKQTNTSPNKKNGEKLKAKSNSVNGMGTVAAGKKTKQKIKPKKSATIKGKVTKNKTKKINKAKNTIKFKMLFTRKKKSGKKTAQL